MSGKASTVCIVVCSAIRASVDLCGLPLWLAFVALEHYKLATRMSNSVERALPPLDLTGSSSQVAERWRQWKRSYQYYIDGKGITSASRKTAQLLHLAGMEVQDIFQDLPDPGPINAEQDNEYVVCLRKLDAHFRAEDNVPYERHVFRQLAPTKGETAGLQVIHYRIEMGWDGVRVE